MERLVSMGRIILCLITLLAFNTAYAAAGCCSHHGGVQGCNTQTNHDLCKDGTTSPTCLCSGGTTSNTQTNTQTKTKKVVQPVANTAPATTSTTTSTTSNAAAVTTSTKKATKGCCARHGGVAGCDASGFSKCKDGSVSATCKC